MISAFGIEHTFSKSYIPGKGYKKVTELGHFDKLALHNKRKPLKQNNSAKGRRLYGEQLDSLRNAKAKGQTKKLAFTGKNKLARLASKRKVEGRQVHADALPKDERGEIKGFALPNHKGGGHLVLAHDAPKHVLRHELQHLKPKRNPVRFHERATGSEKVNGREEGRADFLTHGKQTSGEYPGSPEFKQGYDEVQYKMARARERKKK